VGGCIIVCLAAAPCLMPTCRAEMRHSPKVRVSHGCLTPFVTVLLAETAKTCVYCTAYFRGPAGSGFRVLQARHILLHPQECPAIAGEPFGTHTPSVFPFFLPPFPDTMSPCGWHPRTPRFCQWHACGIVGLGSRPVCSYLRAQDARSCDFVLAVI
jgi:hypothetical protein